MTKRLIYLFDHRLNLITLLLLFWFLFWTLDGFDKFFDSEPRIVFDSWASKGAVVNDKDDVIYTIQPQLPKGWYGVNHKEQAVSYFKSIHVSPGAAIAATYTFAVLEILVGLLFLTLFVWHMLPDSREDKQNMFTDRTLHRLAYKASVSLFLVLSVGYQLFGDRAKLWEMGTYLAMTLIGYDIWYRTDRFLLQLRKKKLAGIDDDDETNSAQASAYYLKDKKLESAD